MSNNNFISAQDALRQFNDGHYLKAGMMAVGILAITMCVAKTVKAGVSSVLSKEPPKPENVAGPQPTTPTTHSTEQVTPVAGTIIIEAMQPGDEPRPVATVHRKLGPDDLVDVTHLAQKDIETSMQPDDDDVRSAATSLGQQLKT